MRMCFAKLAVVGVCLVGLAGCGRQEKDSGAVGAAAAPNAAEMPVSAQAEKPKTSPVAVSDETVDIYQSLYSSGVIRPIRFSTQADPREAMREEIYLEAQLAHRAEETTLAQNRSLLADIGYYQGVEILNAWLRHQVRNEQITTSAIEAYYEAHRKQFTQPEEVVFHHLFLLVPPSDEAAEKQKREEIEKLHRQAQRGADFERLVTESSELPGAKTDSGKVGPVPTQRLNKTIQTALGNLKPGEISGPVRTPYGWELLRLDERTSQGVTPLEDVRQQIAEALLLEKAKAVQVSATEKLRQQYPVTVNEELLATSAPLTSSSIILSVGESKMSVADLLDAISATYAFGDIKDERERIRAALPRMTLTEQVKAAARQEGILDTPAMQTRLRLIRNRLLGEQMYKRHITSQLPSEAEVKAKYEESKTTLFRKPPQAKGMLYQWRVGQEAGQTSAGASQSYKLEVLRQQVEQLVEKVKQGQISREELAKHADETTSLDWFREGPMGYAHDMAFFKTDPGNFTPVFRTKEGLSLGWVEARKDPEPLPYEECRQRVRSFLINERSTAERKAMVEQILQQYARGA